MYRFYTYLLFALLIAAMSSCDSNKFVVSGNIGGADNVGVYFDNYNFISSESMMIAKDETGGSGDFKLVLEENPGPGYYRLRLGAKSAYVILDGSEKGFKITGDLKEFSKFGYKVEGAGDTEAFIEKMNGFATKAIDVKSIQEYVKNDAPAEVALPMALMLFGGSVDFANLHVELSQKIKEAMPDNPMTSDYMAMADAMSKEFMRSQALSAVRVGEMAPDIDLPGPDGKTRKLSDYQGSIVLLDFWASWCGPCRRENPNVVRTYDKYKDRGFTVFSVSLDGLDNRTKKRFEGTGQVESQIQRSKQRWVAAIEKDNLKWDGHVSDLKKWDSKAAAKYGVRSIPQTFLIGRDGKIAAINPRHNLEQTLLQVI